jgi:DNA recombination protein RmuC
LDDALGKLSKSDNERARATEEITELRARLGRLEETVVQERRQAEEKQRLLSQAREEMTREFKLLAEQIMSRHGENFSRQNKEQIDETLKPLREKLVEFQQGLQSAHTESEKERARLAEQIRLLSENSARMSAETQNLTQALKGKSQTQGAWGEMVLASILEKSGLRAGEEYQVQESQTNEDGQRLRPDVVVQLPEGRRIVIDAKMSLTAFEACVNTEEDAERIGFLKDHVGSMRTHIRVLASKEYQTSTPGSLDYVVMFVPIEGALALALEAEPELTAEAVANNVCIATPTTLMIALRTAANVWQVEQRNRNAEAIAERAGRVYDKMVRFVSDMQVLGNRLDQAQKSFHSAMRTLSSGQGNILRQLEQVKELGARTGKAMPAEWLEDEPRTSEGEAEKAAIPA